MFKVTRFCVQSYSYRGRQLVADQAEQFYRRETAIRSARAMRKRVAGVAVYEVTGWPVQDLWDRPRLIARAGELP